MNAKHFINTKDIKSIMAVDGYTVNVDLVENKFHSTVYDINDDISDYYPSAYELMGDRAYIKPFFRITTFDLSEYYAFFDSGGDFENTRRLLKSNELEFIECKSEYHLKREMKYD